MLLAHERFGASEHMACRDIGHLPTGPLSKGVRPDQLLMRAAEYAPHWPDLARRYAECQAAPPSWHIPS